MKIAYFDSGLTFDDPNLRWGSPAYLLEPGDPGYTPPIQSNHATSNKKKKMKHNNYYPMRQGDQVTWLGNFVGKLPPLTATLGLTAGQVTAAVADCNWIIYVQQSWLPATRTWALSGTDALNEALTGTGSVPQVLPVFIAPALPVGVVAVNAGALTRIFTLIQTIKDSGKCSDTNASLLGITGSAQSGPDLTTVQPVIAASIMGNQVNLKWGWGGNGAYLDSCEIQVDRNDTKGFVLLTIDTTPRYTDTQTFPATSVKWTYKATYRVSDNQVGLWSQTTSVTVPA